MTNDPDDKALDDLGVALLSLALIAIAAFALHQWWLLTTDIAAIIAGLIWAAQHPFLSSRGYDTQDVSSQLSPLDTAAHEMLADH